MLTPMKKIYGVIFDLDNCLSPVDKTDPALFEPVFLTLRSTNNGTFSEDALQVAFDDFWRLPLDLIEVRHGFSPAMKQSARAAYSELEVKTLTGYPDLPLLAKIEVPKFLVTTGFRRFQESKIRALGIAPLFEAVHVDVIDEVGRKGKIGLFAEILETHRLNADEVLVIGDNPESEI